MSLFTIVFRLACEHEQYDWIIRLEICEEPTLIMRD
jgi:hypothetical protein